MIHLIHRLLRRATQAFGRVSMPPLSRFTRYAVAAAILAAVTIALPAQAIAGAVRAGFNTNSFQATDDGSTDLVSLGFTANYFGTIRTGAYINTNGNITFSSRLATYTPFPLTTTGKAIIAPLFSDVDTRGAGSGVMSYGTGTVDGRLAFGVSWINVGYFDTHADKLNSFQLVLISRSDVGVGDFDIEFNYDKIQWEAGDSSGGVGGLGGSSARAGYANGVGSTLELAGSGIAGSFLDSNLVSGLVYGSLNSNVLGRYVIQVRNGVVNVTPPIADAGPDQTVNESNPVTLDGTASHDTNSPLKPITYSWSQLSGVPVSLLNATSATPSFTAPSVSAAGAVLVFELTVSNGASAATTDTVTINVANVYTPPIANAGPDQTVGEGAAVTLNGTASRDTNTPLRPITYAWSQVSGVAVTLLNATSATPSFTAPSVPVAGATLVFNLTVSNGVTTPTSDTVTINVSNVNTPPTANAGLGQTVPENSTVTLSGSGFDADNDPLTLTWTQIGGPTVAVTGSNTPTPSFTAPAVSFAQGTIDLTFRLTVNDGFVNSGPSTVIVHVYNTNAAPSANAGLDQSVNELDNVTLDGSLSSDSNNDTLTYAWTQIGGSPAIALTGANTARPTFRAPEVAPGGTTLTFRLTVSDGELTSIASTNVRINNVDTPPIADAGSDQAVGEGTLVTLSGTASHDTNNPLRQITYAWSQVSGVPVTLLNATSVTPSFTAPSVPVAGATLVLKLTVSNGVTTPTTDTVTINVTNVNVPPTANAGVAQTVPENSTVTLSGSGFDPDNDPLTLAWTQIGGPTVAVTGPDTPTPSFTAPAVSFAQGTIDLTFRLVVNDGFVSSGPSTVIVHVNNTNVPPIANAGPDQSVNELNGVALDGSLSSDPNNDALTYAWTQIGGLPAVALTGANTAKPTFVAPEVAPAGTTLTFRLTVSDGELTSTASTNVRINNVDTLPIANAGSDQTVGEGALVTLNGTASHDTNNPPRPITYEWTQVSGVPVTLLNANTATPSFTTPTVPVAGATLVFKLTVSNGVTPPTTDTVTINVSNVNTPPTANAGLAQTVPENSIVTLSGSGFDPDNDPLTLTWTQIGGPVVAVTGSDTPTPSFTAPAVSFAQGMIDLTFRLTVNDGFISSGPSTVIVHVNNTNAPPIANAGLDRSVSELNNVALDGSLSSDPNNDTLTYAWTQIGGLPTVALTAANTARPTFLAPEVTPGGTTLTFQLTVSDGELTSTASTNVRISNVNHVPIADAGPDQTVPESTPVWLDGSASADTDSDALTYAWVQTGGPSVSLVGAATAAPTFVTPDIGGNGAVLKFKLTVNDSYGGVASDEVNVNVTYLNRPPTAYAGDDQIVNEGVIVVIAATAFDPDGNPLTYAWTQLSGPPVTLTDVSALMPSFTAPLVTRAETNVVLKLTVTDAYGGSVSDDVKIHIANINHPPVADAPANLSVPEGSLVSLIGQGTDPDSEEQGQLTYRWQQIAPVTGPIYATSSHSFTAPIVTGGGDPEAKATLTFRLTVTDPNGVSATDDVNVVVTNVDHAPTAIAGGNLTVNEAASVTLNGSASTDPDGDALTYSWVQVSGPTVTLSEANTAYPYFTAPTVGPEGATLKFQLTVNDGYSGTSSDTATVTVTNIINPPTPNPQPSIDTLWPPNHDMVEVSIIGLNDANNIARVTITGVTQDEPTEGGGDGDTPIDAIINADGTVLLRAERSREGDGRVYHIHFTVSNSEGSVSGVVKVIVPPKVRKAAIDGGELFDSTR